jgi:hypothetical protein
MLPRKIAPRPASLSIEPSTSEIVPGGQRSEDEHPRNRRQDLPVVAVLVNHAKPKLNVVQRPLSQQKRARPALAQRLKLLDVCPGDLRPTLDGRATLPQRYNTSSDDLRSSHQMIPWNETSSSRRGLPPAAWIETESSRREWRTVESPRRSSSRANLGTGLAQPAGLSVARRARSSQGLALRIDLRGSIAVGYRSV